MEKLASSAGKRVRIVRWIARILSGLVIVFFSIFFVGEAILFPTPDSTPLTGNAMLQLTLTGLSLLGLALAWKWEAFGGLLALAAYVILVIVNPKAFSVFPLALLALLFLACWWMDKKRIS